MKYIITFLIFLVSLSSFGQHETKRVLFLGNSYTSVNDLPKMVSDAAISVGDTIIYDSNAPGGYTLNGHSTNTTSLSKIAVGNWDYVVLQEQSQMPSFPINQVETDVFPYARKLDSIITATNACTETVFYMTWGRKNGDASNCGFFPPLCTYEGMDSLLSLRYRMMADSNNAILSPVGAVWKYLRKNFPLIDLYQADESHPSVAGTYAAACCFYTALFRKDPSTISFNATLAAADAATIRAAAKTVVYDNLKNWNIGSFDPSAKYNYTMPSATQIICTNTSKNATSYFWNFGDGDTSSSVNPSHSYSTSGSYKVILTAKNCKLKDTTSRIIQIQNTVGIQTQDGNQISFYPNPINTSLIIHQNNFDVLKYTISNMAGETVLTGILQNKENQISGASISDGVYFLNLFNNEKLVRTAEFIKSTK